MRGSLENTEAFVSLTAQLFLCVGIRPLRVKALVEVWLQTGSTDQEDAVLNPQSAEVRLSL